MDIILCPTRGGQASVPNQLKAIAIAKERNASLIFLHVSDVQFLNVYASKIVLHDIEEELEEMGEFLLAMAQERAEKAGVRADAVVRQGIFSDALKAVIAEYGVTTLVLGVSLADRGLTNYDYMSDLVRQLIAEIPLEVFLVRAGEILDHFQS